MRNFRIPLRLIVSGVSFGESANRRLQWACLQLAGPGNSMVETMSRSRSFKDSSIDETNERFNPPGLWIGVRIYLPEVARNHLVVVFSFVWHSVPMKQD